MRNRQAFPWTKKIFVSRAELTASDFNVSPTGNIIRPILSSFYPSIYQWRTALFIGMMSRIIFRDTIGYIIKIIRNILKNYNDSTQIVSDVYLSKKLSSQYHWQRKKAVIVIYLFSLKLIIVFGTTFVRSDRVVHWNYDGPKEFFGIDSVSNHELRNRRISFHDMAQDLSPSGDVTSNSTLSFARTILEAVWMPGFSGVKSAAD